MVSSSGSMERLHALMEFLKGDFNTSTARWAVITATPQTTAGAMVYKREMVSQHTFEVFSTWESASGFLQLDLPAPPTVVFFKEIAASAAGLSEPARP